MSRKAWNESTKIAAADGSPQFVHPPVHRDRPEHAATMAVDAFDMLLKAAHVRPRRAEAFRKLLARLWYDVEVRRALDRHEVKAAIASFARYAEAIEQARPELAGPDRAALELLGIVVLVQEPKGDFGPMGRIASPFVRARRPQMRNGGSEVRPDARQLAATKGPMTGMTQASDRPRSDPRPVDSPTNQHPALPR